MVRATLAKKLGNSAFIYQFCQKMGLAELIDEICGSVEPPNSPLTIGEVVTALVVNRLQHPLPLYQIEKWASKSGFEELISCDAKNLNDDRLARTLDRIDPYRVDIQEALVLRVLTQFDIKPAAVHYDITSLYFEGMYEEVDWVTYGYSRDKKPDKVQAELAVTTTDEEHVPICWTILPGNTNDTTTVIDNFKILQQRFPRAKIIHIGDRAMISAGIIVEALDRGIDLITPLKSYPVVQETIERILNLDPLVEVMDDTKSTVKFKLWEESICSEKVTSGTRLRSIIIWSAGQAQAAERRLTKKIQSVRRELVTLQNKLNRPYWRKKEKFHRNVSKLLQSPDMQEYFEVHVGGEDNAVTLEVREYDHIREGLLRRAGYYLLVTTLTPEEYPTETIFRMYKRQHYVERHFSDLKKTLKIRPIFVQKDERIRGLIFITMLALIIFTLLELVLTRAGDPMSGRKILDALDGFIIMQLVLPDGTIEHLLGPLTPLQERLLVLFNCQDLPDWIVSRMDHRRQKLSGTQSPSSEVLSR